MEGLISDKTKRVCSDVKKARRSEGEGIAAVDSWKSEDRGVVAPVGRARVMVCRNELKLLDDAAPIDGLPIGELGR